MRRSGNSTMRLQSASDLSNFSILLGFVLLSALLGICRIVPLTMLPGPTVKAPIFQHQFATTVPKGGAIVVSLTRDNKQYLNDSTVTIDELRPKLLGLRRTNGNAPLYLAIDRRIPYGKVVDIWFRIQVNSKEVVSLVVSGRDLFDQRILSVIFEPYFIPPCISTPSVNRQMLETIE